MRRNFARAARGMLNLDMIGPHLRRLLRHSHLHDNERAHCLYYVRYHLAIAGEMPSPLNHLERYERELARKECNIRNGITALAEAGF